MLNLFHTAVMAMLAALQVYMLGRQNVASLVAEIGTDALVQAATATVQTPTMGNADVPLHAYDMDENKAQWHSYATEESSKWWKVPADVSKCAPDAPTSMLLITKDVTKEDLVPSAWLPWVSKMQTDTRISST